MKTLGVDNYHVCIVAIKSNFQSSLETTALLDELGAKFIVSRASSDFHSKFLLKNGADKVIFPEKQMAKWTAIRYTSNNILDYVEFDENIAAFELYVPDRWLGKTLAQLDIRKKYNVNIIGIIKNGKLSSSISPDTVFTKDQPIFVVGTYKDVQKCFKL